MDPPKVKSVRLRGVEISPPLWLAPMAGITHTAFRRLLLEEGWAGCLSTEMLSARRLKSESARSSPFLKRHPSEKPLSYQIVAWEPEHAAGAAKWLTAIGADVIDLNFGCPAPAVRRMGGGSKLMENLEDSARILQSARGATNLPLTAKTRLGETLDEGKLRDFCQMLEDVGIDMIAVHARLRGEPYGRRPRWEWIGKVKEWVKVPVVGNGGIFTPEDARECLRVSGCDGLMIGRGAAVKPWLGREIAREVFGLETEDRAVDLPALYRRFARLLEESFTSERRLGRLKEFTHYFAMNYPFGHTLASKVQVAESFEEAVSRAEEFFAKALGGIV
ncbi:tRNA-dihydrouridine synthase family protein [bacterium]|nr:MAG: tRNA-dihydrouridine synthase family protein [bacterium]